MRGFILGLIVALLIVFGGAYYYATTGHLDTRAAGNAPSMFERRTANKSVDAWVDGHAPKQANPFQPTMDNVIWLHDLRQELRILPWQPEAAEFANAQQLLSACSTANEPNSRRS